MTGLEFFIMSMFTVIGIKYIVDMIKYSKGYEINGKCRYGKKYARSLEKKKRCNRADETRNEINNDIHNDIDRLISALAVS